MATPEISTILEQVADELIAMRLNGETGSVTIHVGRDQMVVKGATGREYEAVRRERARMNVIRRPR